MDKPTNLAFSDYATFRFFRAEIMFFIGLIASALILARVTSDEPLASVTLSEAVMSGLCPVWVGVFVVGAWGYRVWEKISINRMFRGEIWECWQLSSSEWKSKVEAVCNLMSPVDEGKETYSGVIASSIIGLVLGLILFAVSIFAVKDPVVKIPMRYAAVGLFLFMIGVGFFQPMVEKNNADRYRRKALKFPEPRIWFGPKGIYHEALGHTSLKELHKVTDQTKSREAIQFTLVVSTESSDDLVKIRFPVPSGCEERASRLVRRYRTERLHT